jgi:hypothetical protein
MSQAEGGASRLSVLILVDHQSAGLLEIHREAVAHIEKFGLPYELLYLLPARSQFMAEEVLSLRAEDPERIRVLRFGGVVGDAAKLATGFHRARGQILFTLPSSFAADMSALEKLYEAIEAGADVAVGSRGAWTLNPSARWQSRVFNRIVSALTAAPLTDVASPVRAIRREVVAEVPLYGDFHRYLPILAHNAGFNVQEVPVPQDPRATAPVLHSPRIYLWRAMDLLSMFFLSRFTRRPLRLFGAVGTAFASVGASILLVVGVQRLMGTPLAGRPILVLGTLLLGLGVQAFTIGLLGELLLFFHARNIREYRIAQVFEDEATREGGENPPSAETG